MYKHILFVEDELYIAELYAQVLTSHNYDVTVVGDGEKGLKAAQTGQYDLILLDLMLPNMTGMDILRRLRDPAQSPNVPASTAIIVLTNLDEDDQTKNEIKKLAQGYLLKVQVTPKQLVEIIRNMENASATA